MIGKVCFCTSRWVGAGGISGDDGTVTTIREGTAGVFASGRDIGHCKVCDAD